MALPKSGYGDKNTDQCQGTATRNPTKAANRDKAQIHVGVRRHDEIVIREGPRMDPWGDEVKREEQARTRLLAAGA